MGGKASKRRTEGEGSRDVTEEQWSPEDVIQAIRDAMGSMADAARALGADRTTLYLYRKRYPGVRQALDEVRAEYKESCSEFARDNHLSQLINGGKEATAYELAKLEPKPDSVNIDPNKLSLEEIATLRYLLEKGKPDGPAAA
jgi:hypothetical protein